MWPGSSRLTRRERGARTGYEAERQERVDRLVVEVDGNEAAGQQALELRREDEQVADPRVVQRLDTEAVAHDHAAPPPSVPDPDPEHAAQVPRELEAVPRVQRRQHFRIAARAEREAVALEAVTEQGVVEELAVLHRPDVECPRSRTADGPPRRRRRSAGGRRRRRPGPRRIRRRPARDGPSRPSSAATDPTAPPRGGRRRPGSHRRFHTCDDPAYERSTAPGTDPLTGVRRVSLAERSATAEGLAGTHRDASQALALAQLRRARPRSAICGSRRTRADV